ncbi:MAG TPA: bifunctional DNA-formamidopyrimidine glycosylase/DNA-(apurinic or apyrimidinic site) lyase, partial [Polyangiaceae bacterium]|nr:bifunctional DNA-formamidopyrimidine glycosylase/DNA-(apurinic or apyrimidinic site) lyase [Polyangiaceae bacterium]
ARHPKGAPTHRSPRVKRRKNCDQRHVSFARVRTTSVCDYNSASRMPELPEVEVTRRQLLPFFVDRTIEDIATTKPSYFFITRPKELARRLIGHRICALDRVGKYLLLRLDDDSTVLLHLGMTGQLFAAGASNPRLLSATQKRALGPRQQLDFTPDVHTHLVFAFRDPGPKVFFRDVRKFGKVAWLPAGKQHSRLEKLGKDALGASGADLFEASQRRKVEIKSLLLDQGVIAGIGNIYADEALFLAGVRVTRPAHRVTRAECEKIVRAAQQVMLRSIETGGSSISDYVRPDGSDGGYQNERRVYARTGEACGVCGQPIQRIVIAQRSSHFCKHCQK